MILRIFKNSIFISTFFLTACYSTQYVTKPNYPSEASLVAHSYHNGLSEEIDIPYEQAFNNLKQAYQHCVAFTTEQDMVYTDNRLEPDLEMGTLFVKVHPGKFLQKTLVEGLSSNKTRITLFVPKEYSFADTRFKKDVLRALGQDTECNVGVVIPVQY